MIAGLMTGSALGQGRIATIDLQKIFDSYWKTKQADGSLKERAADMDKEFKNMVSDFEKVKDEYQKLLNSASDQEVSQDERDKRKKGAEEKLKYLRDQDETIQQYRRQASTTLDEQRKRMRDNILGEIRVLINGKAKSKGFMMVIDSSAESFNKTPILLFNATPDDLTDEVAKELNSTAPADVPGTKPEPADTKKTDEKKK
jgi:outer membrane protein